MVHDIIKQAISKEISEKGGASLMLVNKNTVPLENSIKAAKDGLYVVGDEQLVKGQFQGVFKSIIAGLQRDGHARQLGDFCTFYLQPTGPIDLDKGWDPKVNSLMVRCRLLKEMKLDTSSWTFRDVTPGRIPFTLNSAATGADEGKVRIGEVVHINGVDIPAPGELRVEWSVPGTDKSGKVDPAHLTSDCTRVDIAAAALAELTDAVYDGKAIVFTLRGNKAKSQVKALLVCTAALGPKVVNVQDADTSIQPFMLTSYQSFTVTGERLANAQVTLKYHSKSRNEDVASDADVSDNTDTAFTAVIPASDSKMDAENARLVVTTSEGTTEVPVKFVG